MTMPTDSIQKRPTLGTGSNLGKGFPKDICSIETSERDAVL